MSTAFELTGTVKQIDEEKSFASGFRKREFVITTDEKYPQDIKLEAVKDGCDCLDAYEDGDPITVSFNLRGNEYNGKHYVNLQAWKFDRTTPEAKQNARERQALPKSMPPDESDIIGNDDDDIPF